MNVECQFPHCLWKGCFDKLLNHCEEKHETFIVKINDRNVFNFKFTQMLDAAFLLVGTNGLYWFLLDQLAPDGIARKGVFAAGNSKVCDYLIKIGTLGDDYVACKGPFTTQPDGCGRYDLLWTFGELEVKQERVQSNSMQVVVRPHDFKSTHKQYEAKLRAFENIFKYRT